MKVSNVIEENKWIGFLKGFVDVEIILNIDI